MRNLFIFLASLFGVFILYTMLGSAKTVTAAPVWRLPYPNGTPNLYSGISGLHGCNFNSIDNYTFINPGNPVSTTNPDCDNTYAQGDASLDIGFNTSDAYGNGAAPAVALASGTVLDANKTCNLVLIDNGSGWWSIYIHLVNLQVSTGQHVTAGQALGTPNINVSNCNQGVYGNYPHVHFAMLQGSGTSGTYQSMAGQVLCGHTVLSNASAPGGPLEQGWMNNVQELESPFSVPSSCPGTLPPSQLSSMRRSNTTATNGSIAILGTNSQGYVSINSECSGCTGGWSGWSTITPSPATFTGKVSLTFDPNQELTVFARDTNGNIWFISECNSNSNCPSGSAWQGWNEIPGFQTPYDPSVVDYDTNKDIEVFANGTDQTLYYIYWQNSAWHGWNHVTDTKAFATNAQPGINQSSAINVFEKDSSGSIWHIWTPFGSPTGWSAWNNDGSTFLTNASPIRYDGAGDLDLLAQSNLNVVGNDPVINGAWAGWSQTTSNPSGISFTGMIPGSIDPGNIPETFTRDTTTGAIWHQWGGPGAWSAWTSIGGNAATDPSIATHIDNTIDVFIFGADGNIYLNQQCGSGGASNCNPTWPGWVSLGSMN